MHAICERIIDSKDAADTRPVVVAFGGAKFSVTSKGYASGPVEGVRQALRRMWVEVYDVNEDYTSQLCHHCHEKLVLMYSQGGEGRGGSAIHCVRRCLTATCVRNILNRDVNAAVNMLYVFEHEVQYRVRPQCYTRAYQQRHN